jgi:NAD(P)-dependent dehydrogenase (short-subunit alcohol dehydrogenase family)
MEQEFADKIVVIGGGVGELGGPVSTGFVARGAKVIIPFVSEMKLAAFVGKYPDAAKSIQFQRVDLAVAESVERFVKGLREREGRVDVLVNLTGGYRPGELVSDGGLYEYEAMWNINFAAIYHLTRALLPLMLERGAGSIVNVSSRAGLAGSAGNAAYSIAKAAVIRFTEALADEVKHQGIVVNCVLPSTIDTPRNRMEMPEAAHQEWVNAEDLAEVIWFLASPRARAIHGAAIPVYGLG